MLHKKGVLTASPEGTDHAVSAHPREYGGVNGVPLHVVQKWMWYAQLSTMAIYADAIGEIGTTHRRPDVG